MIRLFRQYISPRKMTFIMGEGILIFISVTLAALFFLKDNINTLDTLQLIWPKVLIISVMTQLVLYFNDLYRFTISDNIVDLASRLVRSIGMTSIALAIVYFLWPKLIIGRWIFLSSLIILISFLVSWRLLYALVIRRKLFVENIVLLGTSELADRIREEINNRTDLGYNISATISSWEKQNVLDSEPACEGFNNFCDYAVSQNAGCVVVAVDQKRGVFPYRELLDCKMRGVNVIDGESFYERITGKLIVEKIKPSWFIFADGFVNTKITRLVKRLVDVILSTILLILLSPIILIVTVAIMMNSRGPAIFAQERVGVLGRIFTLFKFRSMVTGAEKETGPIWATDNDPRITGVGRMIRKVRADEIPQLWNVLKGDMSFVGPRPERPYFVKKLKNIVPYYNERFSVKPGITGWAQIRYGYGNSVEDALEKLKYDLYYIKNMSFAIDMIVIFQTAKIVLLGRGSR